MSGNKLESIAALHISHFDSEINSNLESEDLIKAIQYELEITHNILQRILRGL